MADVEQYVKHVLALKTHLPPEDLRAIGVLYESLLELERENEQLKRGDPTIDVEELKKRLRSPFDGATTSCPQCGFLRGIGNWHRGVPSDVLEVVGQICRDALAVIEQHGRSNAEGGDEPGSLQQKAL